VVIAPRSSVVLHQNSRRNHLPETTTAWYCGIVYRDIPVVAKGAIHVPAEITREVLKNYFTRYLRGIHAEITSGIYTVTSSKIRKILGIRCSFWWWGAVVSSSFACGARVFLFFQSSRPFLPPCACAFSCSVHRHGLWLGAFLFAIAHSSPLDSTAAVFIIMGRV